MEVVSTKELMNLLDVSKVRIGQLAKQGIIKKLDRNKFDKEESVKSYYNFKKSGRYDGNFNKSTHLESFVYKSEIEEERIEINKTVEIKESYEINKDKKASGIYEALLSCDKHTIQSILRISDHRLHNLISDNVFISRNNSFNLPECIQRYNKLLINEHDENKVTIDEAKRRKELAEAELKEAQLKEVRGDLVRRDEIIKEVVHILGDFKAKLLAIPSKAAPMTYGLEKNEIQHILKQLLHDTLEEVSRVKEL